MLRFQEEDPVDFFRDSDLEPLWREYYEEFAPVHKLPYGYDAHHYTKMAILNDSIIVSARECGRLQGVTWSMLAQNIFHATTICAHINAIFLRKEFRKQGLAANGVKLILKTMDAIKKRGVSKIYIYPNVLIPF